MSGFLNDMAARQFDEALDSARVILIHPRCRDQRRLLAQVPPDHAYVRFEAPIDNLDAVREVIERAAEASALLLVLDECDRVEPAALTAFVRGWLEANREGRLILFSRELVLALLDAPDLQPQLRVVPVDESRLLIDYARRHEANLLEVRGFGAGSILLNGRPVETWEGILPRSLFFYLVDRGRAPRADIFDTFWSHLTRKEATNVFHVTKRKIKEVLGFDLTTFKGGHYTIAAPIMLRYDVNLFLSAIEAAMNTAGDERIAQLETALDVYTGEFLSALDMPWAAARRAQLAAARGEAVYQLSVAYAARDEVAIAFGYALRAVAADRGREAATAHLMRLGGQLGFREDARWHYEQFAAVLAAPRGRKPSRKLQALAASIGDGTADG